ncbi:hypothetical protein HMPREF0201_01581 [Cedecea davisae DSM 4568]|uniref:Uncharacterized protein n=1 Tax=Cedecea davisae DSM 4568 TaxID=566551 RepID=S3IZ43_9ENTR|nr:hypothetical protein HMPREF0201_01581 [Cedecea davisae DSM 4568]
MRSPRNFYKASLSSFLSPETRKGTSAQPRDICHFSKIPVKKTEIHSRRKYKALKNENKTH